MKQRVVKLTARMHEQLRYEAFMYRTTKIQIVREGFTRYQSDPTPGVAAVWDQGLGYSGTPLCLTLSNDENGLIEAQAAKEGRAAAAIIRDSIARWFNDQAS